MADQFYLIVACKPYVKRFLEINFGNPVDLSGDIMLRTMIRQSLKKPDKKFDKILGEMSCRYCETIRVKISDDEFYRYGWELWKSDTVKFGKEIESRVKFMMRTLVAVNLSLNGSIKMSIIHFQDRFEFQEDVWPYDTIKKEFFRNGIHDQIDFNDEIFNKLENIIMVNLSKKGTVLPQALKHYEIPIPAEK
jgi:hypothetical protein